MYDKHVQTCLYYHRNVCLIYLHLFRRDWIELEINSQSIIRKTWFCSKFLYRVNTQDFLGTIQCIWVSLGCQLKCFVGLESTYGSFFSAINWCAYIYYATVAVFITRLSGTLDSDFDLLQPNAYVEWLLNCIFDCCRTTNSHSCTLQRSTA